MKECGRCHLFKPLDQFYVSKGRPNSWCKECFKDWAADRWANKPDKREDARKRWLSFRYGITPEDYVGRLEEQGGRCAVCPATEPGAKRTYFAVDHDHATGAVRGLLCHSCNTAIGLMGDDPSRLRNAATYLEHAGREP